MILLKEGVRLLGIRPEMVFAIMVSESIYGTVPETLVVTSVVDGQHMRASLHYVGAAADFSLPQHNAIVVRQRLAEALGPDFDVVLEDDHMHVEWQPKVSY